ncbi:MAG: hypothetical protein K8H84_08290 [Sulfuricella denitrificans]|nr:hypothetical protein [Sulfuricella denitrificans]
MTPTADVAYLGICLPPSERNLRLLREAPHSQLPVCKGDLQQIIGIAESHDILQAAIEGDVDFAETVTRSIRCLPFAVTSISEGLPDFPFSESIYSSIVAAFGNITSVKPNWLMSVMRMG